MNTNHPEIPQEGLVLIDKPVGISSFGVVARLRRATGVRRIGHAGTLDPMASGLLICLIGRAYTRQAGTYLKLDKVYEVEIALGANSTTGDQEGELTPISEQVPTLAEVKRAIAQFTGEIMQTPPQYSAIKVAGKRAYDLARRGETVELAARPVTIYSIEQVQYQYPKLSFVARVSSGTYIRSLGEDIGAALGTGAYVTQLRRTQIGEFDIADATSITPV